MVENFTKSWYDALETQLRSRIARHAARCSVSYTLSRSYLDGVDFFLTMRGTQRTPHERGYNPSDQRHNLTVAGTRGSAVVDSGERDPEADQRIADQGAGRERSGRRRVADRRSAGRYSHHGRPRARGRIAGRDQRVSPSRAASRPSIGRCSRWIPIARWMCGSTKSLPIGGNRRLELLIEGFNVTNHVNFRPPFGNPPGAGVPMNAAAFLVRTSARDARQIQWGLRYTF